MPFVYYYDPSDGVPSESKVGALTGAATNVPGVLTNATPPSANQVLATTDANDATWTSTPTINITGSASLDLPLTGGSLSGAISIPSGDFYTWTTAGDQIPGIGATASTNGIMVLQTYGGTGAVYINPNPSTGTGGLVVCAGGVTTFSAVGGISGAGVVSGTSLSVSGQVGGGSANITGAVLGGQFTDTIDNLTPGSGSYTVSWASGAIVNLDLTTSTTITFSGAVAGQTLTFFLTQGGSGSNTVAWANTIRWPGGTAPTLTTTESKTDVISFFYNGSSYFGFIGGLNF